MKPFFAQILLEGPFVTAGKAWICPNFRSSLAFSRTFGWDQSQARTYGAACRHTALTALAQLRTATIRSAMAGLTVPPDTGVGPGAAADVAGISDPDLRIPLGGAPLPAHGGQPRPPSIPVIALTAAETARLARLAAWTAGHLDRASLAFHLRWSKWRRRHQATARWHHYATRLQALAA